MAGRVFRLPQFRYSVTGASLNMRDRKKKIYTALVHPSFSQSSLSSTLRPSIEPTVIGSSV